MVRRFVTLACVAGLALLSTGAGAQTPTPRTAAPVSPDELVTKKRLAAPKNAKNWTPPRTAWGDPDIAGVFTNSDESGIPFERPAEFEGRKLEDVSPTELADMVKQRQKQAIERAPSTAGRGSFRIRLTEKSRR